MSHETGSDDAACVLYVDDYAINLKLMGALFEMCTDYRLVHAGSGREALALPCPVKPAVLLLDLNLPDIHGSRLLPLLRRQNDWCDVPAVAVTADHGFDALGAGFCELWPKPLDLRHVLRRLEVLTRRGLHRQNASGDAPWPAPAARRPFRPAPSLRGPGPL